MSGGNFTLQGGFRGIISAVQTPGAPPLSITLNSGLSIGMSTCLNEALDAAHEQSAESATVSSA
jgi:hypothetical protein